MVAGLFLAYRLNGLAWVGFSPRAAAVGDNSHGSPAAITVRPVADTGPREVAAIGRLEPAGGILTIGEALGDRLTTLEVEEGTIVTKDKLLATLESHKLRELEIKSYDAQIREAEARRTAEENLAEARIETAKLNLKRAESHQIEEAAQEKQVAAYAANLAVEERNLIRFEGLSKELVSTQERERQALLVKRSAAELAASEASLARLKQTAEFTLAAAKADLNAAIAAKSQVVAAIPVDSLKSARDVAQLNLERTSVLAPSKGTVLKIHARPGEVLARKPILQMADLDQMVCVAEVYETELHKISVGQTAVIKSPAFGSELAEKGISGSVSRVGRLIATPEMKSIDPFARADRHVVEVRIELDRTASRAASALVNLQVDVTFKSRSGAATRTTE